MEAKKILFITQEIIPYVEESEVSIYGKKLPVAAQENGMEVRIFMEDYFMKRLMAYDKDGNEYPDNGERAVFYARGVLETVKKLRWCPDVIVCQGWMGALVPFYIKTLYKEEPSFRDSKVIYLAHSYELKASIGSGFINSLYHKNLDSGILEKNKKEQYHYDDLLHIAIDNSDGIIMGSPDISESTKAIINDSGKLVMPYPTDAEEFPTRCNDFYNQVFCSDKNEE